MLKKLEFSDVHLPEGGDGDSDSLGVGLLQLAHLSRLLDAEVDLVAVLAHDLELDVLGVFAHGVALNAGAGPLKMAPG